MATFQGSNPCFLCLFVSQAVTALVKNFPKPMVSSMQQILPIVWNTLTESAALYPVIYVLAVSSLPAIV